jgi:hypothetical protein
LPHPLLDRVAGFTPFQALPIRLVGASSRIGILSFFGGFVEDKTEQPAPDLMGEILAQRANSSSHELSATKRRQLQSAAAWVANRFHGPEHYLNTCTAHTAGRVVDGQETIMVRFVFSGLRNWYCEYSGLMPDEEYKLRLTLKAMVEDQLECLVTASFKILESSRA